MNFLKQKQKKSQTPVSASEAEQLSQKKTSYSTPYVVALLTPENSLSPLLRRVKNTTNTETPYSTQNKAPKQEASPWFVSNNEINPKEKIKEGSVKIITYAKWRHCPAVLKYMKYNNPTSSNLINNEIEISQYMRPHPHILAFFGYGKILGRVHLALFEYQMNGSLDQFVGANTLSPTTLIQYIKGIVCGLSHLQRERVVHRNLQPSSILLNSANEVVIGDFSFAALLPKFKFSFIETREWCLTLMPKKRMAPESLLRKEFSFASDVFSLGMLIWELASVRVPLTDRIEEQLLIYAVRSQPHLIDGIHSNYPLQIEELIRKCLQPIATNRPKIEEVLEFLCL